MTRSVWTNKRTKSVDGQPEYSTPSLMLSGGGGIKIQMLKYIKSNNYSVILVNAICHANTWRC